MQEALDIINNEKESGYMVHFEHAESIFLRSDCFPDKNAGEKLIATEEEAWHLARKFAAKTFGKCVNIYVVDANFRPVQFYKDKIIVNR